MIIKILLFGFFVFLSLWNRAAGETFPIDIVYLWVDGSDQEWQKIKEDYLSLCNEKKSVDASSHNRYSDNQELKYSLRSVWKYAPFFNHLFIVTMNQRPSWLIPHPKVTVIDHTEIFADLTDLPTFNSMAIEANIHHIPHLSEHFLYFNDDMFLACPTKISDFFSDEGNIRVLLEKRVVMPSNHIKIKNNAYLHAARNTNALLDAKYRKEQRLFVCHAPYALRKSHMQETEAVFPEIFISNSSHKFRSLGDHIITNGLIQYYCIYTKQAAKGQISNVMINLEEDKDLKKTAYKLRKIAEAHPHTFCLQDNMTEKSKRTRLMLRQFLEKLYPEPAPWEQLK